MTDCPLHRIVQDATKLRMSRRGAFRLIGAGAVYTAGFATHLAVSEAIVQVAEDLPWWKKRAAPLVTPARMGKRNILERASQRQARAIALIEAGKPLDDDALSRATVTFMRGGKRWMEYQGERIGLWPGWHGSEVPMEDQPDREYGLWAARQLDEAALLGEPVLDRVSADVMQIDGRMMRCRYVRLRIPTKNAVYSVTERA